MIIPQRDNGANPNLPDHSGIGKGHSRVFKSEQNQFELVSESIGKLKVIGGPF